MHTVPVAGTCGNCRGTSKCTVCGAVGKHFRLKWSFSKDIIYRCKLVVGILEISKIVQSPARRPITRGLYIAGSGGNCRGMCTHVCISLGKHFSFEIATLSTIV